MGMRDFRQLKVWQKSQQLALDAYHVTASFPQEERYGLTSQIRRAASSISANIAEGCGRNTVADLARFLHVAMGSASELESHLLLAKGLEYCVDMVETLTGQVIEVKKMLSSLIVSLRADV